MRAYGEFSVCLLRRGQEKGRTVRMQLRPLQAEKDGSMSHLHIPGGVECLEDIVYKRVHDGAGGFMDGSR